MKVNTHELRSMNDPSIYLPIGQAVSDEIETMYEALESESQVPYLLSYEESSSHVQGAVVLTNDDGEITKRNKNDARHEDILVPTSDDGGDFEATNKSNTEEAEEHHGNKNTSIPSFFGAAANGSLVSNLTSEGSTEDDSSITSRVSLPNGEQVTATDLTELLKIVLPCEDLNHKLTLYRNCFKVNHAIECFKKHFRECKDDNDAIAFGRVLQRAGIIKHVSDDSKPFQHGDYFFRLQCYHQPQILNSYRVASTDYKGDAMTLIENLSGLMLRIEREEQSSKNSLVDYSSMSSSKLFPTFESMAADLQGVDLGILGAATRLAVALNAYNIMIKYAFAKLGVATTRMTRAQFFSEVKINFGGDIVSFDDIEHGIIRGNKPRPGVLSSVPFAPNDHRVRLAMPYLDHRIHFYLDCYPTPLKPVTVRPETISKDLDQAAQIYLADQLNLWTSLTNNEICLNKVFSWYSSDFSSHRDWRALLSLLEIYTGGARKNDIQQMLKRVKPPIISYSEFTWGIKADNFESFKVSKLRPNEKWGRA